MTEDIMAFALSLWPERKDLNPRTMREDVMLSIMAAVVRRESLHLTSLIEANISLRSDRVQFLEHQVAELQKANDKEAIRCRELKDAARYVISNIEGYEGIKDRLRAALDKEITKS